MLGSKGVRKLYRDILNLGTLVGMLIIKSMGIHFHLDELPLPYFIAENEWNWSFGILDRKVN